MGQTTSGSGASFHHTPGGQALWLEQVGQECEMLLLLLNFASVVSNSVRPQQTAAHQPPDP